VVVMYGFVGYVVYHTESLKLGSLHCHEVNRRIHFSAGASSSRLRSRVGDPSGCRISYLLAKNDMTQVDEVVAGSLGNVFN
jgi:hypothetical protein